MNLQIDTPLTLKCGLTLPNRLVKAAMTEQMADKDKLPTPRMVEVYRTWASGNWGMILTGNVQVDSAYLGGPDDTAVDDSVSDEQILAAWKIWAATTQGTGSPLIMQINHPGRQSPLGAGKRSLFAKNLAPSAVPMQLGEGFLPGMLGTMVFGTPKEMTVVEIQDVVRRFARTAKLAAEAGFAGVQIHGAHGYLLNQFMSPRSNKRTDAYGGSEKARVKIVVEVIEAVRKATPKGFCVGIKLNSADHQSAVQLRECIEQLEEIAKAGVDFLEISGGTYEDPQMIQGSNDTNEKSSRTSEREAFFLEFARAIRERLRDTPLIVTGGFRTRQAMQKAIAEGDCDMVGLARPAVLNPLLPKKVIFNSEVKDDDAKLYARRIETPWIMKQLGMGAVGAGAETMWYSKQISMIRDE